jgi:hypothetical protein
MRGKKRKSPLGKGDIKRLRRLRATLRGIRSRAQSMMYYMGWDDVMDATERAIQKTGVYLTTFFHPTLRGMESLGRKYSGYKMHVDTALIGTHRAIGVVNRLIGKD